MPINHSTSFMFFRTVTRSPAGSEIPSERNREHFQAFSLQIGYRIIPLLVMTDAGSPWTFYEVLGKDSAAPSSKLQQAWLRKTGIFSFIIIITLCLFTWEDSPDACDFHWFTNLLAWIFFPAYRFWSFLVLHSLIVILSSWWYVQPVLQFLTIVKNFISKPVCLLWCQY